MRPEMANMGGEIYAGRERASVAKESGGVWAAAAELAPRLTLFLQHLKWSCEGSGLRQMLRP